MVIDFASIFYYISGLFILAAVAAALVAYFIFKFLRQVLANLQARHYGEKKTFQKIPQKAKHSTAMAGRVSLALLVITVVIGYSWPSIVEQAQGIKMEFNRMGFDLGLMATVILGISLLTIMAIIFIDYSERKFAKWEERQKNRLDQISILEDKKSVSKQRSTKIPYDGEMDDQPDLFPRHQPPGYRSGKYVNVNLPEKNTNLAG